MFTTSALILASGPRGSSGPAGSSNATTLRGTALDASVAAPANGSILVWDANSQTWIASPVLDMGTW